MPIFWACSTRSGPSEPIFSRCGSGGGLEGVALGDDEPAAEDHQQRGGDQQDGVASAAGLGTAADDVGRRHLEPPGDGAEAVHALLDLAQRLAEPALELAEGRRDGLDALLRGDADLAGRLLQVGLAEGEQHDEPAVVDLQLAERLEHLDVGVLLVACGAAGAWSG